MNKFNSLNRYFGVIWAIIIFVIVSIPLYYFFPSLSNGLIPALATFIVGCFAIALYIRQKEDQKKDAANVILAEIRQAERLIEQFRNSGISNDASYQLLPSNHWSKYNYLFINDLDSDEIEQINSFYSQCHVLDKAIDQIHISHQLKCKSESIHKTLSMIAKESMGNKEVYELSKNNFLNLIQNDPYVFKADAPIQAIVKALNNLRFLTTSTVGAKLKIIADIK